MGLCSYSFATDASSLTSQAGSDLTSSAGGHQTAWVPSEHAQSYIVGGHSYGHQAQGPSPQVYNPYGYHSGIQAGAASYQQAGPPVYAHAEPAPLPVYKPAPVIHEAPKKVVHQHHEHQRIVHQHHIQ